MLPRRNLRSYLVRLRNASVPEVAYRIRQAVLIRRLRRQGKSAHSFLSVPDVDRSVLEGLKLPDFCAAADQTLVKLILEGKTFSLNGDIQAIASFEEACRGRFFSDIPLPNSPDIRQVWEPARLQHITILLVGSAEGASGADPKLLTAFAKDALLGWIEKNPFLTGPHYLSAMECGLRIPVFFYGMKLLDDLSDDEVRRILRATYEHAWWVSRRLSLYTSLGNHTVCECIGLVFAGTVFARSAIGRSWLTHGIQLLEKELRHQILEDGGPTEQSLAYHRFVLDLYWLAVNFLEKNGLADCATWKLRLLRGEFFQAPFKNASGQMPSIGDSDDGSAIAPGLDPARGLAKGREEHCRCFRESGYTVVRFGDNALLTFDHGPLGMPPLNNHGHADALSVTLTIGGRPFLVDPGTYRYNGIPEWRKYFKGTRAHNTVNVDGEDQAVQETEFVWGKPYQAGLVDLKELGRGLTISASHNGYGRLKDALTHLRRVAVENGLVIVSDCFEGKGVHDFELNFHLHPDVHTQKQNGWWHMRNGDASVFIRMLKCPDFISVAGQEEQPFGWYSAAYGLKVKSHVLCCRKRGAATAVSFLTAISLDEPLSMDAYMEKASVL